MHDHYDNSAAPRQRGMTPLRVTLAAGVPQRFPVHGDWIHCLDAAAGDLTVRFDDSEQVPLPASVGFRRYYRDVALESATGGAFVVLVGFGSVADGRASVTANLTVNTAPGNTLGDGGDVVCPNADTAQLLALDAARLYAVISNPSANTATVRLGSAAVTAASGIPLEPGETVTIGTTAAIHARNDSGAPVTISAASVRQV